MTERAARKPIPRSYKMWLNEVTGLRNFLMNAPESKADFGEQWVRNMIAYNKERLAHLLANKPRTPLDRK